MGFWRFQGLVKVRRPDAVPGQAKSWKNNENTWFPKQCLHYGVLGFSRAGECLKPVRSSRTRKIIKKPSVFKLFQKKWCWRSSFGLHLFIFWRMLQLICLFLLRNLVWPHNSASSVTWRPRELRTPKWSQNHPKMIPKWSQNDCKISWIYNIILKYITSWYYNILNL